MLSGKLSSKDNKYEALTWTLFVKVGRISAGVISLSDFDTRMLNMHVSKSDKVMAKSDTFQQGKIILSDFGTRIYGKVGQQTTAV